MSKAGGRSAAGTRALMFCSTSPIWLAGHVASDVAVGMAPRPVGGAAAGEVVVLIRGEDEQGVRLVDAVRGKAREEGTEGLVVGVQLGDVVSLART